MLHQTLQLKLHAHAVSEDSVDPMGAVLRQSNSKTSSNNSKTNSSSSSSGSGSGSGGGMVKKESAVESSGVALFSSPFAFPTRSC